MTSIQSPGSLPSISQTPPINSTAAPKQGEGFSQLVSELLQSTNSDQLQAEQVLQGFVTEGEGSVQDVVLAMSKADLSFRFLMELRNQLIESYQEITRMQV